MHLKPPQVRQDFLPFAKPDLGEAEVEAVSEVIRSGWLTTGPRTREFEERFAEYVGAKHAIAVNSATAALHLALEAIGLQASDEVIVPTMTFAATAEVVRYFNATPVLVDMQATTFNLDPEQVAAHVTPRTKAIMPVHVGGQAADLDEIHAIAKQHGLYVIEDAAHALPSFYHGQMIGNLSDFTTFSFYVTKTLATGEGGMITTDNDEWADRCRVMSLHGISKDAWKRYTKSGSWYYEIVAPGYKYNMTDMAAALGLVQLDKVEAMYQRRLSIAQAYDEHLGPHWAFEPPIALTDRNHPYHLYILRLNLDRLTLGRDAFIEALRDANIGTSVHWIPLHMHPYYAHNYGYRPDNFPVAYREYQRIISLPIYPTMSDEDVMYVVQNLMHIAENHRK